MIPTINDPLLKVSLCRLASSRDPIAAIWMHQHVCVSESVDWTRNRRPSRKGMVNAILIELGRGHWDVLTAAHAQVNFEGYPHDAAMQWRTHQNMGTLTQSLRFTGKRFMNPFGDNPPKVAELFYGVEDESLYWPSIENYQKAINRGIKMEVARRLLPAGYRQGWSCAGNLKHWLHLLDRRLLGDTQIEARHAAWAAFDQLREWCPEVMDWYKENRAGKNKLAP
jgi:flavin-dependent thymidylate synthase